MKCDEDVYFLKYLMRFVAEEKKVVDALKRKEKFLTWLLL